MQNMQNMQNQQLKPQPSVDLDALLRYEVEQLCRPLEMMLAELNAQSQPDIFDNKGTISKCS